MAVFEKKIPRKITLDDTDVLTCTIENTQNIHGHTEYVLRVQRGPSPDKSWQIYKRYNDFVSLHQVLMTSGLHLPMPPKKILGNMNREFIAERKTALQRYLNVILQNRYLALTVAVKKFLDPDHYSFPFEELALQHVCMVLRGEIHCHVIRHLPEIGTRLRKHYFLVSSNSESPGPMLLSWCEHGPDKFLDEKYMKAVFKALASIQHPFIQPIELSGVNDTGGFVVRQPNPNGSLRDLLMGVCKPAVSNDHAMWQQHFLIKYCEGKGKSCTEKEKDGIGIGLSEDELAKYGAQILDGLIFLQDKGLPFCGHIHSGNIVINGGVARILDVENSVLGLPPFSRHFLLQLPKQKQPIPSQCQDTTCSNKRGPLEIADAYCFGRTLYEMATGKELADATIDSMPSVSPSLRSLLEQTLSLESCRHGLPTLHQLRMHPFFRGIERESRGQLKLSNSLRDALRLARIKVEERFLDDQRMLRHQKRLAKVREILNSSDEKKLRRLKTAQSFQTKATGNQPSANLGEYSSNVGSEHLEDVLQETVVTLNGRSPEEMRSDSPNSNSTATSAGTSSPPPLPITNPEGRATTSRGALLGSICNFDRTVLKHVSANIMDSSNR